MGSDHLGSPFITATDNKNLKDIGSRFAKHLSRIASSDPDLGTLLCVGHEASLVSAVASTQISHPVQVLAPSPRGELFPLLGNSVLIVLDGQERLLETLRLLQNVEHATGRLVGLVFVHEPTDGRLIRRLSDAGYKTVALIKASRTRPHLERFGEKLCQIRPSQLDESGERSVFVESDSGSLVEVPGRAWASWPAMAQLTEIRRLTGLPDPAEPRVFAPRRSFGIRRSKQGSLICQSGQAKILRNTLLGGADDSDLLALELRGLLTETAGLGIGIYASGAQISCRVCLRPVDVESLAKTIRLVRTEVHNWSSTAVEGPTPVVLLSLLEKGRSLSVQEFSGDHIRLGEHTLMTGDSSRPFLILAHVPCFMGWNKRELLAALEKKSGSRATQIWVLPTRTVWITADGAVQECSGGLPKRQKPLETVEHIANEISLTAMYLSEQLNPDRFISNSYNPRVDRGVFEGSRARKAIALSALVRAGASASSEAAVEQAQSALESLAAESWNARDKEQSPARVLEQAHMLLAMALLPDRKRFEPHISRYLEPVCSCVGSEGGILAESLPPAAPERSYLPGVVLTAIATCQHNQNIWLLNPSQYQSNLCYYRRRFGTSPRWPDVWWQLRAWSAIYTFLPTTAVLEFVESMVEWAIKYQLKSGAFLTWEWPTAPCFQTACVAEGLVSAARVLETRQSPRLNRRLIRIVKRAIEFCSSLVVDECHSALFPSASRSVGGVRSWHGEIELRTDAAGHYVHALIDYRQLLSTHVQG